MNLDESLFYSEAFSRNIGIFSEEEQKKLRNAKVAIAGMGGVGGIYLLSLARLGIGNFHIADFDSFEIANINRQAGADTQTAGRSKVEVMAEMAKKINPYLKIREFPEGVTSSNIDVFLEGVEVLLDGLDFFNIRDRVLLFSKARERGIYSVTSAPIGFGASLLVFSPDGMSFEEYFDIREGMDEEEMILRFGLGLSPSLLHRSYFYPKLVNLREKKVPSTVISTLLCANLALSASVKILLDKGFEAAPRSIQFDPYLGKLRKVNLLRGNRGMLQRLKRFYIKKFVFSKA